MRTFPTVWVPFLSHLQMYLPEEKSWQIAWRPQGELLQGLSPPSPSPMDVKDVIVIWMQNIQNICNIAAVSNHEAVAAVDVLYSSKIPDDCDNDDVDVAVTESDVKMICGGNTPWCHITDNIREWSIAFWIQFYRLNYSGSYAIKPRSKNLSSHGFLKISLFNEFHFIHCFTN